MEAAAAVSKAEKAALAGTNAVTNAVATAHADSGW